MDLEPQRMDRMDLEPQHPFKIALELEWRTILASLVVIKSSLMQDIKAVSDNWKQLVPFKFNSRLLSRHNLTLGYPSQKVSPLQILPLLLSLF
jgi:hypothetical protein